LEEDFMAKRFHLALLIFAGILCVSALWVAAQESAPENSVIRKVVDMVQLNVAVTDGNGNYVAGLHPADFSIIEDRIPETIATFEEGNEAPRAVVPGAGEPTLIARFPAAAGRSPNASLSSSAPASPAGMTSVSGASVFILFDTSNYMYRGRGFVFAQDSIAEFVRSLDGADQVAFYSYSRDLSREAMLTPDRSQVLRGVREAVNGDDSGLYDALLLTLRDAAQHTGRKVVVVFSNGPDNSSMVPPEDVGELAQSEGVPIYMVSTREAKLDPISAAVFGRISSSTGGETYFAKDWKEQQQAFASIRNDLAHLYLLSYYPQSNPNRGWRAISVKLVGPRLRKYHLRTRSGYRPAPERTSVAVTPDP
jgi:Ca-activated chloride channel family protein